ncbi:MAG: MFS transporter [Candidatus Pacebacteria bacterium]|nr:MFS transporter [Candidatus Paceibacterota bacterium]
MATTGSRKATSTHSSVSAVDADHARNNKSEDTAGPPLSSARTRFRRHLFYALVITVLVVIAGYHQVLPVFRSHFKNYLQIGDARFGFLFSISALPSLISILLGGQLIDRWGPRRMIRIGLTGLGTSMFVVAFAGQRFWPFAVAAGIAGVFSGPLFIAVSAYLGKLFPNNQRQVLSLNLASTSAGGMMFPLVAEGFLTLARRSETIAFRHILHLPFFIVGSIVLVSSLIYRKRAHAGLSAGDAPASSDNRSWHWRDLLLPRHSFFLAALIAVHGISDSTIHVWMARFLESRSFHAALIAPGLVMSAHSLAYLLARGVLAALPDRVGRRMFMIVPGLLGGGILIGGILSRDYLLTACGYIVASFCWSCEYPAMVSTLLRTDRRRFGAGMAVAGVISSMIRFLLLIGMGILIERLGEQMMWLVMLVPACGFPLIGVGGWVWQRWYGE